MAKRIDQVNGALGTGSTSDITSSGIGSPDGAILFISGATSTDTDADHALLAIVLWDGTTAYSLAFRSQDGVGTTSTTDYLTDNGVALFAC